MTAFLFLQRFDDGAAAPMPFEAVMEVLARHGVGGRGRGDPEFTFEPDQVAAVCTVVGSSAEGVACVAFERPRFDAPLRRAVWQCMASFGCTAFTDSLDTVYALTPPPASLDAGSVNGVRLVSAAQQLWPEPLELPAPSAPRPALRYTNPNPNGTNYQLFDSADFEANEMCLELALRPEACNPGTLRALRNLMLRADAAIGTNPEYRLVYRFAHFESSVLLMESRPLGELASGGTVVTPPPGEAQMEQRFYPSQEMLEGALAEAAKLTRHVQDKYQLALDGSAASIDVLAGLLDKVRAFYVHERDKQPAGGAPFHSELAASWALKAGCYLGTVMQRQLNGQWGHIERGLHRLPVVLTGAGLVHPHLQVLDHIINGPGDNIARWFRQVAQATVPFHMQPAPPAPVAGCASPPDMEMAAALAAVRAALEGWRASATQDDYLELREGDGGWLHEDALGEVLGAQTMLLSSGTVHWGALVQANLDLFEPGPDDLPAALVYSRDPHFDGHPLALRGIASALLAAAAGDDAPLPLRAIGAKLREGADRFQNLPVPALLTERRAFVTTFAVFRQHLPGGVLAGRSWFPVLVHPYAHSVMIVPRQFWPATLSRGWTTGELFA